MYLKSQQTVPLRREYDPLQSPAHINTQLPLHDIEKYLERNQARCVSVYIIIEYYYNVKSQNFHIYTKMYGDYLMISAG